MTKELNKLLSEYDFLSEDIDVAEILKKTIEYINKLESDNKTLEEIISIQRHNLSLLRKEKKK